VMKRSDAFLRTINLSMSWIASIDRACSKAYSVKMSRRY